MISSGRCSSSEAPLKVRVIYRSTGPGNRKGRPPFFDKLLSLASLLQSVERCDERPELIFVNDGPIPGPRLAIMQGAGRVVALPGVGNSGSYRRVVAEAIAPGLADGDLVYLVEDDYLHLPAALPALVEGSQQTRAAFFTLYDHPDHYVNPESSADAQWRQVPSTTMTFAARRGALARVRWLHWLGTVPHTPRDHLIWLSSQRVGIFRLIPGRTPGPLVTATPALATHLEMGFLAAGVDWAAAAAQASDWAAGQGWPREEGPGAVTV